MQIAAVHNMHSAGNEYADFIYTLLEEEALKKGYTVQHWGRQAGASLKENTLVNIGCKYSSQLAAGIWYGITLPSILKKMNASVLINLDGVIHHSVQIPQSAVTGNVSLLFDKKQCNTQTEIFAANSYNRSKGRPCSFIVPSAAQQKLLTRENNNASADIIYYTPMLPARQVQWHEKLMIKAKESGNTEYFLSVIDDDMDTFMILMKAFSKFKKWQQSSMQFILISSNDFLMDEINEKLSSYKYRNDVKLLTGASAGRSEDLVCAAYAFIYIQQQPISVSDLLSVMQNGTPVICSGNSELNGYSDDAVVQVEKNNAEALGDAMLHLYKNENTRTQKSEAGIQRVSLYKKEDQAQKLWSFLLYSAGGDI